MFCENCGNKLEVTALFCEECGTKCALATEVIDEPVVTSESSEEAILETEPVAIEAEYTPTVEQPTEAEKTSKKNANIFLIVQALLCLTLAFVFYSTGAKLSEPSSLIESYAQAYMAQDYKTLTCFVPGKYIDLMTPALMDSIGIDVAIDNYTIDIIESNSKKDCTLTYTIMGDDTELQTTFSLEKTKEKHWFIFDQWAVMDIDHITYDFQLAVPYGLEVSYNDEPIAELDWDTEEKDGSTIYTIPAAFTGSYVFVIDSGFNKPYAQAIDFTDSYCLLEVERIDSKLQEELIAENYLIVSFIIEHAATNQISTPLANFLNPYNGFNDESAYSYRYGLVNLFAATDIEALSVDNFSSKIYAPTYDSKEELFTLIIETNLDCFYFGSVFQYGSAYTPPSYFDETITGFRTEYVYYDDEWILSEFYVE